MKKEILRLKNIQAARDGILRLKNLNLCIYEREILGIYGMYDSGKTTLFDVLTGRIPITYGTVFFLEQPSFSGEWLPYIARISNENLLVGSMTVWKSVLALRKIRGHKFLLPAAFLKNEMQQYLDSFGLPIDAAQPVYTLNPLQKQMLEILKACLLGKKIILVDSLPADFSEEDYQLFYSFLQKIKGEGSSVLIAGSSLLALRPCTDTIFYLTDGSIQKSLRSRLEPEHYFRLLSGSSTSKQDFLFPKNNHSFAGNPSDLNEKCLLISDRESISLTLYKGRIVTITDPSYALSTCLEERLFHSSSQEKRNLTINGKPVSHIQQHHGILWMDFKTADRLIPSLSPLDNICMNQHSRFTRLGVIPRTTRQTIINEFNRWYGSSDLMNRSNCYNLSKKDTLALILFRLHLARPRILLCRDSGESTESSFAKLICLELKDMAEQGTAVCIFLQDKQHSFYEVYT